MMKSPTETILAKAAEVTTIVDSNGRTLTVRRLTALDRLRLFKALGPVLSHNSAYLGMAMLASSVTAIDEIPVPAAATEAQIETLVAKLGDPGISAIAAGLGRVAQGEPEGLAPGN